MTARTDGAVSAAAPVPRRFGSDPLPTSWKRGAAAPRLWSVRVRGHADRAAADGHLLDAGERTQAQAFVRAVDRDRYRVAHVALRRLLGAYLGGDPATVEIVREPCPGCGGLHGRPAVPGAPLHFSLSYSADLVLLAFADTPVGADVERVPSPETAAEVATALHPAESAEIAALPGDRRAAAFARCWTRKEAFLKGTGMGLAEDPSVTYVGTGPDPAQPPGWTVADIALPSDCPDYAAACAVRLTRTG